MRKFLISLFVIACSVLLLMSPSVFARESGEVQIEKEQISVKPTKSEDKNRSCEEVKTRLGNKAEKFLQKAELFKTEYDKIAKENDGAVDPELLASREAAVTSAIAVARADIAKLSCPVASLKTSMKQLEKDLQYVNKALNGYRKTLKGLKGKSERKKATISPVLGIKSCTVAQVSAKKKVMTKLVTSADTLAAKYAAKTKTSGALSKAIVQSKRLAFDAALRKAKEDMTALVCENGSMQQGVKRFKTDMQTALKALKAYRQSLLDVSEDLSQKTLEQEVNNLPIVN